MSDRLGRCYELAGREVILPGDRFHPGRGAPVLVHGTIQGFGNPPNPHAWIEFRDGTVWEPITEQYFGAGEWVAFANPGAEAVRYTVQEARRRAVVTGHWGPWDT